MCDAMTWLLCYRVGAKYIGTCTCMYISTFFRVFACTLYFSFENVLVHYEVLGTCRQVHCKYIPFW